MTEFRNTRLPEFKLGINKLTRDLTKFQTSSPNKPMIVPKQPQPNIYFAPIDDNREQILNNLKNELNNQLEFTKTYLPPRS
jgi:hypothetical protein